MNRWNVQCSVDPSITKTTDADTAGDALDLLEVIVKPNSSTLSVEMNPSTFLTLDSVNNSVPYEVDHPKTPATVSSANNDMLSLKNAAAQGKVELVKYLCTKNEIIQKLVAHVQNKDGDTPLFAASKWDQAEIVRILLGAAKESSKNLMVDLINLQNDSMEKETPISYAASRYHKNSCLAMIDLVVSLRLDPDQLTKSTLPGTETNETGIDRTFSQDLGAVFSGVRILGAEKGEIKAVKPRLGFCKLPTDAVKKFVEDNEPIIKYHQKNARDKSLIVVLLRKMPHLVEEILNKSITLTEIRCQRDNERGDIHRVIVDFGVLEYHPKPKDNKTQEIYDSEEDAGPTVKPRHYRHGLNPLQVLAKTNRPELLRHPVVYALIMKKWENYAKGYFYSVTFLLYILFFSLLMVYQSTLIKPYVALKTKNGTDMIQSWIENSSHSCNEYPDGCVKEKSTTCLTSGYFILIMSGCRLFLEMLDLLNQIFVESHLKNQENVFYDSSTRYVSKYTMYLETWLIGVGNYLRHTENLLEVTLYGTSVVFSLNVLEDGVISPLYWQIGTFCVLTSFTNLLLLLQIMPLIGVYITMFFRILWTFVTKILALLTFFVIAFVIIFHMLLSHTTIFRKAVSGESVYKTLSQGVSGVAYEDYDLELSFPVSTLVGLIAFAILVQVLFLNLATGLAIEDVKKIRVGAEMAMNVLKIRHIFNAGRSLTIIRQVFNHVRFLKGREPKPFKLLKRFQNMPSKNFKPEIIQKIHDVMENTERKEIPLEGNVLSISFKIDIDQLARLKIIQTEDC